MNQQVTNQGDWSISKLREFLKIQPGYQEGQCDSAFNWYMYHLMFPTRTDIIDEFNNTSDFAKIIAFLRMKTHNLPTESYLKLWAECYGLKVVLQEGTLFHMIAPGDSVTLYDDLTFVNEFEYSLTSELKVTRCIRYVIVQTGRFYYSGSHQEIIRHPKLGTIINGKSYIGNIYEGKVYFEIKHHPLLSDNDLIQMISI